MSAAFSRRGDAVTGALGDEPGFEVRDGTEDVEHELAGGRGGIETLLEADQVDAAGLEAVNGFEQLAQRASQTVEPGDAQAVTGSGVVDELGQTGAVRALSGGDVGEDADGARFEQAVSLGVEALVSGRDAGVAQRVAGTGGFFTRAGSTATA